MRAKNRILVVDSDEEMRKTLKKILEKDYEVTLAVDGIEAIKETVRNLPDLILLDINMHRLDGFQACEIFRQDSSTSRVPIIMISTLQNSQERIRAFRVGADDYIAKPVEPEELLVRLDSKIKRFQQLTSRSEVIIKDSFLACGNLKLDLNTFEVWLNSKPIKMSLLEFKLIKYLVDNKGTLCRREEILAKVWETPNKSIRILDAHIMTLRKKLYDFDHQITSVYGGGYILKPPHHA